MRRELALLAGGAAAGTVGALLARLRARPGLAEPPGADRRADDLRRKLAEARATAVDAEDFEGAGMAGETVVTEEQPVARPTREDVGEARRRVHEDARAAAEEMRGDGEGREP